MKWICCQLGAREHYAIPRALLRVHMLECLLTDAWFPPGSALAKVSSHTSDVRRRFQSELSAARVRAFNSSFLLFEMLARARRLGMWPSILARDRWFQRKVVSALRDYPTTGQQGNPVDFLTTDHGPLTTDQSILFAYSYAARDVFRFAKSRGWRTVLGQIDPGPEEGRIVAEEAARVPELAGGWQPAPPEYWACWREECALADRIIVNSEWSREGLIRGGVPGEKLAVIPLAYEREGLQEHGTTRPREKALQDYGTTRRHDRKYPDRFTDERPMRVLFLGLINLRKGVARLLEAARILRDEPVEFWMVGPVEIANASILENGGRRGFPQGSGYRVKWFGPVARKQAVAFYRKADVFILPTLSDGFAITQLEAQAYGLPIIVSKTCGKVVEDGLNGIVLQEPSATCIAAAVRDCTANPDRLEKLAAASRMRDEFTIHALARRLQEIGSAL